MQILIGYSKTIKGGKIEYKNGDFHVDLSLPGQKYDFDTGTWKEYVTQVDINGGRLSGKYIIKGTFSSDMLEGKMELEFLGNYNDMDASLGLDIISTNPNNSFDMDIDMNLKNTRTKINSLSVEKPSKDKTVDLSSL